MAVGGIPLPVRAPRARTTSRIRIPEKVHQELTSVGAATTKNAKPVVNQEKDMPKKSS